MATSKKLITINDKNNKKIDLITTEYNDNFINNRNNKGRPIINYYNLSEEEFKLKKQNKINHLKRKTIKELDVLCFLNVFKYLITIHVNNKKQYNNLMDKLKKADKNMSFLSLASWSKISNLHYHILLNSSLNNENIEKRLNYLDYDIKLINNQKNLVGYLRKNIVKDTIGVLNLDTEEVKNKQIDILKYKNILSHSRNLNKPIIKKIDSNLKIKDIKELKDTIHLKNDTITYKNIDSTVKIDKFIK